MVEVGGVGELLLRVVAGLLDQNLGLEELALHVVGVNQLVVLGDVSLEEVVQLGKQLCHEDPLLVLDQA